MFVKAVISLWFWFHYIQDLTVQRKGCPNLWSILLWQPVQNWYVLDRKEFLRFIYPNLMLTRVFKQKYTIAPPSQIYGYATVIFVLYLYYCLVLYRTLWYMYFSPFFLLCLISTILMQLLLLLHSNWF